jgi:hypothetical protein
VARPAAAATAMPASAGFQADLVIVWLGGILDLLDG